MIDGVRFSSSHRQAGFADVVLLLGTFLTGTVAAAFASTPATLLAPVPPPILMQASTQEYPPLPSTTPTLIPEPIQREEQQALTVVHQSMGKTAQPADEGESGQLVAEQPPSPTPTIIVPSPTTPPPTATPTHPPFPTISPTATTTAPSPAPSMTPGVPAPASLVSAPLPPVPKQSLSADTILALINAHRKEKGLPALEKEDRLCALAQSRGPELHDEIFVTHTVHAGFYRRNLPYWITENMASYGSEEAIVHWWLGSPIHRKAIEGAYRYSCGTCFGNSCAQLFTNYTPK